LCALLLTLISPQLFAHVAKKEYRKALKTWSRSDELYQRQDFYASMKWDVTYFSPDFFAAQVDEVARIYDSSPAENAKYGNDQHAKFGGFTIFFVSFYGYDYKNSDLAKKNSVWTLRMEVGGERYDPVKFESVNKPTPLDRQLYPYINTWARHYFVYFPKISVLNPGDLKLKINGPYSQGSLSW
jgi:hypothetical protein